MLAGAVADRGVNTTPGLGTEVVDAHDRGDTRPGRSTRPTIHDVARAAGVTIGTVSKALNHRGQLRPETRERVLAEAARLEFRPNDLIKSLLRGRTYTVGLLTTDYFGRFTMPLLAGIEDALGAAEILVFLCNIRDDPDRERKVIASLLAKQVDGIIVTGRRTDPRPAVDIGRSTVPLVYANTRVPDDDALCLLPDDAGGARLAVGHLLDTGRRRVVSITGPAHWDAVAQRRQGMTTALQERGLDLAEDQVWCGPWSEGWGYEAVDQVLAREPAVDAIFCGSDQIARGVIDCLRELGRRIPEEIAIVGFDNWEIIAEATRPPLTTVDLNLHDLGREAAHRLLAMVSGERQTGTVRLPCSLIVRASTGDTPRR